MPEPICSDIMNEMLPGQIGRQSTNRNTNIFVSRASRCKGMLTLFYCDERRCGIETANNVLEPPLGT